MQDIGKNLSQNSLFIVYKLLIVVDLRLKSKQEHAKLPAFDLTLNETGKISSKRDKRHQGF